MNLKFNKDGKLEFNLIDLFDNLPAETKIQLVESLSCDEAILKHVLDQLLDGWTENMYYGATALPEATPFWSLDKAKREVAKRAGEVAKAEIERLERELARQKEENKKESDARWRLFHAWPREFMHRRPWD